MANAYYALVSFRTLIGVEYQCAVSYPDLAEMLRRFSFQPQLDLELLYRQMIVTMLLVNTDDYLQNSAMLHTEQGWCLSPTYDIVPNVYRTEQILQVNSQHSGIRSPHIVLGGQKFGLSRQRYKQILLDVQAKISTEGQGVFAEHAVSLKLTQANSKNISTMAWNA